MAESKPSPTLVQQLYNLVSSPVTYFILFIIYLATVFSRAGTASRAILASGGTATMGTELSKGEIWNIWKYDPMRLENCKSKHPENCFSTADEAHKVFACPSSGDTTTDSVTTDTVTEATDAAVTTDTVTEATDAAVTTDTVTEATGYMMRPLALDEPAQGKPSGCNL